MKFYPEGCVLVRILRSRQFAIRLERILIANHAKAAILEKRETVSGMAEILGVNRSTIQRAIGAIR